MYVRRTSCSSSHSSPSPSSIPPPDAALASSAAALASGSRSQKILDQKRGLERKAPPQHASRFCSGANPRADPGHQEHSEDAVVESREPQPRPAATCCGPVSLPGSPLCSGALGLARASLLGPSRLLLRSSCFGRRSEGRVRPQRAQLLFAAARSRQTGHKAPQCRPRDSCLVRSTDLQGLASRLALCTDHP
jgi:hypothetical protein